MIDLGKNRSVLLSSLNDMSFSLYLHSVSDAMIPELNKESKFFQILCCIYNWIFVLIGSFFRFIAYKYLVRKYKENNFTSINVLILVLIVIQHSNNVMYLITEFLIVINDSSLEHVTGPWFCIASSLLFKFETVYSFIGSFGIALYRVILIKYDHFARYVIETRRLSGIVLFGGIVITLSAVSLLTVTDFPRQFGNKCVKLPNQYWVELMDKYLLSINNNSASEAWKTFRKSTALLCLSACLSEIIMYIIFFHFMYVHDNKENLKKLLGTTVIRKRNSQNAITFFGQFCSFAFEVALSIIYFMSFQQNRLNQIRICLFLKTATFAGMAIIEVLTSNELRSELSNTFKNKKT